MKSVFYVEEDFVAGLLKDYFVVGMATLPHFVQRGSNGLWRTSFRRHGRPVPGAVRGSRKADPDSRTGSAARTQESPPWFSLLTPKKSPNNYKSFAHFVSLPELLESNLRWHVRLAKTMQRCSKRCSAHFADARIALPSCCRTIPTRMRSAADWRCGRFWDATSRQRRWFLRACDPARKHRDGEAARDRNREGHRNTAEEIRSCCRCRSATAASGPSAGRNRSGHRSSSRTVQLPDVTSKTFGRGYGATSSILLEYLAVCRKQRSARAWRPRCCTASRATLSLLTREVNEWDVEAFSYLYPFANQNLMRRIERPELPPAALDALSLALKNRRVIDKVAFVHLGRVERDDLIPQMADFSLQFEGIEWALCQRNLRDELHHFRSQCRLRARGGTRLNEAFGDIGSAGGHASMAKAIIPLSEVSRKWNIDVENLELINNRVQIEFLRSLHSDK